MARLTRKNQKVFAENATNNGVFGSLQAGNPTTSNDIEQIQSLPAYGQGWNAATMTSETLPSLEETQALNFVNTYQLGYILQEGIPEYSASTTYYKGCLVKYVNGANFQILSSKTDNNQGNGVTNQDYWSVQFDSANPPQLISNMEQTVSTSTTKYPSSAAVNSKLVQKENLSNKQNDLTNPDSTHYPTTKAVVDGINSIVSDRLVTIPDEQTITGLKHFRPGGGPCLVTVSDELDSNIASTQTGTSVLALDKNEYPIGSIVPVHTNTGHNGMQLIARNETTSAGIEIYSNGKTNAPTPATGSNDTSIATTNWCNDPNKSTNLLHRTGNETKSSGFLEVLEGYRKKNNNMDITVVPSSDIYHNGYGIYDKEGRRMGAFDTYQTTNGYNWARIYAQDPSGTKFPSIGVGINAAKQTKTYTPAPAAGANSNEIATCGWTNGRITSVMNSYCGLPNYNSILGEYTSTAIITAPKNCYLIATPTNESEKNLRELKITIGSKTYICYNKGTYNVDYDMSTQTFFPLKKGDSFTINTIQNVIVRLIGTF